MARPRKSSKHTHGPSELLSRPSVVRAYGRERRRLALRLRAMREARGLTQEQAAELIGLHPKHMPRLESGEHSVSLQTLVAVAVAYKVPLVMLFDESDVDEKTPTPAPRKATGSRTRPVT